MKSKIPANVQKRDLLVARSIEGQMGVCMSCVCVEYRFEVNILLPP